MVISAKTSGNKTSHPSKLVDMNEIIKNLSKIFEPFGKYFAKIRLQIFNIVTTNNISKFFRNRKSQMKFLALFDP